VARRETTNFYEKALAVLGADEAVLLRRVKPKHGAAHVPVQATRYPVRGGRWPSQSASVPLQVVDEVHAATEIVSSIRSLIVNLDPRQEPLCGGVR